MFDLSTGILLIIVQPSPGYTFYKASGSYPRWSCRPRTQGVMWSASISLIVNLSLQITQMPFCFSYAFNFILSEKARMLRCFSSRVRMYGYIPLFCVTSSSSIRRAVSCSISSALRSASLKSLYSETPIYALHGGWSCLRESGFNPIDHRLKILP